MNFYANDVIPDKGVDETLLLRASQFLIFYTVYKDGGTLSDENLVHQRYLCDCYHIFCERFGKVKLQFKSKLLGLIKPKLDGHYDVPIMKLFSILDEYDEIHVRQPKINPIRNSGYNTRDSKMYDPVTEKLVDFNDPEVQTKFTTIIVIPPNKEPTFLMVVPKDWGKILKFAHNIFHYINYMNVLLNQQIVYNQYDVEYKQYVDERDNKDKEFVTFECWKRINVSCKLHHVEVSLYERERKKWPKRYHDVITFDIWRETKENTDTIKPKEYLQLVKEYSEYEIARNRWVKSFETFELWRVGKTFEKPVSWSKYWQQLVKEFADKSLSQYGNKRIHGPYVVNLYKLFQILKTVQDFNAGIYK